MVVGGARRGFTLIELLVVVVIIGLLAALLLPAIVKAICSAKQGTAESLIDNLSQAAKAYEFDYAVYPPGDGNGSADLVYRLKQPGPKKLAYYEFTQDMLDPAGKGVLNPVWPNEGYPQNVIHYRNNVASGAGGGGGGGGGAGAPTVRNTKSFDMWCAGCSYNTGNPASAWEVNNWE